MSNKLVTIGHPALFCLKSASDVTAEQFDEWVGDMSQLPPWIVTLNPLEVGEGRLHLEKQIYSYAKVDNEDVDFGRWFRKQR